MRKSFTRLPAAAGLALLLAAMLAACAPETPPYSGSSTPAQIDYHSGPYRMQNG